MEQMGPQIYEGLYNRDECERNYKSVLGQQNHKEGNSLDDLDPYYIYNCIFKNEEKLKTKAWSVMGHPKATFKTFKRNGKKIFLGIKGFDNILKELPFEGHSISEITDEKIMAIESALNSLEDLHEDYLNSVLDFTSLIIWLKKNNRQSKNTLITSCSLPHFPHTSFISDKALYHLPPLTLFNNNIIYALQENLYHESLHQKISSSMTFEDYMSKDFDTKSVEKMDIPWREGKSWQPDRILHAFFVYANIFKMRKDEYLMARLPQEDLHCLKSSFSPAIKNILSMLEMLPTLKKHFSEKGLFFLNEITTHSRKTLKDIENIL